MTIISFVVSKSERIDSAFYSRLCEKFYSGTLDFMSLATPDPTIDKTSLKVLRCHL